MLAAKFLSVEGGAPLNFGVGFVGVSWAFGLTVLPTAYAIGHISGCRLNPAVSTGLLVGKRFNAGELDSYVIAHSFNQL